MNPRSEPIPEQDDEEIACVRAVRQKISERFGHDPYRLVAYYMERQQQHMDRLMHAPEAEATEDVSGWQPPPRR
jgi:hypothetical protein